MGVTAAVGIGYLAYKFFTGMKLPGFPGVKIVTSPEQAQQEITKQVLSYYDYLDKWQKNRNGIEVDVHKYSKTGQWEVRVKAPTYPNVWTNGMNYIVVYALPTYDEAKTIADWVTQDMINEAIKQIVPGEVPILIHKSQAIDKWVKNRNGIYVDLHQYSKTKLWEVRIKAPTYPTKWSQNNMNYIVVYALPTVEKAAFVASSINQNIVDQVVAKATPTENPILVSSGFGRIRLGSIGYQVGNRIVW